MRSGEEAVIFAAQARCYQLYIKVEWHHDIPAEPVVLYSELDAQRYELRKVDQYANGRLDYADATRETGTTFLGEAPVPPLAEIAGHEELTPAEITQADFESIWQRATGADHP